jgi:hypothetical protein
MKYLGILLLAVCVQAHAAIPRSQSAKSAFVRTHPCPLPGPHRGTSCPGYVIDHVIPLDCGGPDAPRNMQWQSAVDGKAKDRIERIGCKNGQRVQ